MAARQLSSREQEKADIITAAIAGKITNNQAAKQLRLSVRQVQRAKAAIRKEGIMRVVHGLKGKPGNHRIEENVKEKVLDVIAKNYADFKPSFATEKLEENHGITISYGTTRLWMIEKQLWKSRKQKQITYRSWRPRKEYYGELIQFDGSYHYWFEDRFRDSGGNPIEVCLLSSIDDATGTITKASFAEHEGVIPVFTFWKGYVEEKGKPLGMYLDKFSTYKINHKAAVDNSELITQFQRAMNALGITLILTNSPQAKGRIERLFETLQDRLVKEMRLAKINNPTDRNKFLKEVFIPKFNKQFSVIPAKEGNIHKPLTDFEKRQLSHTFSIYETRRINLDFTIQFKNMWYQLTEIQPTTVRPLEKVCMETWLDESIHIILREHELAYILLPEKPKRQRIRQPIILTTHKLNWKPPKDHAWRKFKFGRGDISILK